MTTTTCTPCITYDTANYVRRPSVTPDQALRIACDILQVSPDDVQGPCRERNLTNARFMIAHYLRHRMALTKVCIGRLFNRDHTTIIHGIQKHNDYFAYEPEYQYKYLTLVQHMEALCWELQPAIAPVGIMPVAV